MTNRLRLPSSYLAIGLCIALVLTWSVPTVLHAQALYGTITGQVRDATGGAIPGAEVTVLNVGTNYSQTTLTNDVGNYTIRNIPDGNYTLTVSLTGFKEYVAQNVVVSAGQVTRENAVLQVGEITESITVSGAATLLKTDTTDVSAQLESKEISDLPLNQFRNYQALVNLVPGATPARFQNAITDTPGRALTTNVNGTNRNSNNTRIDGAISVNIWLPHHTAYVPPSETIEVVDVSTNNFDAEKGFAGGAATTVITKSGTNEFHGNAFWYHENQALNARNFFNFADSDGDGKADKPSGRRHIWGGTIGGPVVQDKFFFFAGFEATQQANARTQTATLPTADQRAGDFSAYDTIIYDPLTGNPDGSGKTAFTNNVIPTERLSAQALAAQDLLPLPNLPGLIDDNFEKSDQEVMNRYNTDFKLDWYRTDEHRIWGKFSWMDASVEKNPMFGVGGGGAVGGGGDGVGDTDVKVYSIGHNWTLSPTFLVDGNFGFTDMDQVVATADLGLGNFGQDVLGIPGTNAATGQDQACIVDGENRCGGVPRFSVSGYSTFGQPDGWSPLFRNEDSITFTQNFSWTSGDHEVRFGYDMVKHMLDHWQPEIGAGPRGRLNFNTNMTATNDIDPGTGELFSPTDQNGWASFLLGTPSYAGKSLQWELMTAREWQHAFYVRDRWQVTPKLTFTLGLRYEFFPLMTRENRGMEVLDIFGPKIACDDPNTTECFAMTLGNDIKVSKNLWAPRLGFAYRLSDNDVFRAGYGITNSPIPFARPLRGFYPLTVAADFNPETSFVPFTTLAEGIPLFVGPDASPGATIPLPSFVQQRSMPVDEITRGYIQSWNVMYERKLPSDFIGSIGYVGTQTVHQLADHQLNYGIPGAGTSGRQLYPYSTTNIMYWDGWLNSNYHSLQLAVNRRFTDGLFVKAAYTYSKAINMTDDEGWAGLNWNQDEILRRNRAQAGYNVPHIFQLATIYALPFGNDSDSMGAKVIRDWQINGVFSVNQNRPFTVGSNSVMETSSNSQTADQVGEVRKIGDVGSGTTYYDTSAFAEPGRVPGTDCTNLDCYGTTGRNILRGPTWVNLDLSIFRTFALTEQTGLEFRAEFFNFTNTPHFNNPSTNVSSSSFMRISSTSSNSPERIMRFGFKLKF